MTYINYLFRNLKFIFLAQLILLLYYQDLLSQNNNFIRPAFGDYFIIESEVQRFGSTIAIGETKIYSEDSRDVICHATSTYPLK